jgi:hypothetical protein
MHNLDHFKKSFNDVGWFIPPYVTIGFMSLLESTISKSNVVFGQDQLEKWLTILYSHENLAAMVVSRYPVTPHVSDYKKIIAEAVEAHFRGLDHVAVGGLLPVVEGVALRLADDHSVRAGYRGVSFKSLAESCKQEVITKNIGAVGEVVSMVDSFLEFTENHLYTNSSRYSLGDNTNRNGILRGAYADGDYGKPINFYKVIASVDFLCFISAIRAHVSWFAPDKTEESSKLELYYRACAEASKKTPGGS